MEMNKEMLMIISMGAGGILGCLGGFRWKWLRRYLLPVIFAIIAIIGGFEVGKALLMALGLIIAYSLPYGESTPYFLKVGVSICHILPFLAIGFSFWMVLYPFVFMGLFWLSNKLPLKELSWKICEFIFFSIQGIILASLIAGR